MFKLVTGNNGRIVYAGRTTRSNDNAVAITGKEWDHSARQHRSKELKLYVGEDMLNNDTGYINSNIPEGEMLMCTVLPHRKHEDYGTAEEIAHQGQVIEITNDHNNEKICIFGEIWSKRWNDAHTMLKLSFRNLKDVEGNYIGTESEYTDKKTGNKKKSYWLNICYFNSSKFNNTYSADRINNELGEGDAVIIVATKKISAYNGKTYTNYNGSKCELVYAASDKMVQQKTA